MIGMTGTDCALAETICPCNHPSYLPCLPKPVFSSLLLMYGRHLLKDGCVGTGTPRTWLAHCYQSQSIIICFAVESPALPFPFGHKLRTNYIIDQLTE